MKVETAEVILVAGVVGIGCIAAAYQNWGIATTVITGIFALLKLTGVKKETP